MDRMSSIPPDRRLMRHAVDAGLPSSLGGPLARIDRCTAAMQRCRRVPGETQAGVLRELRTLPEILTAARNAAGSAVALLNGSKAR